MKKALSILLAVVIMATMSVSVFAAPFVDSIEAKAAPEIVKIKYGDNYYGALIIDGQSGNPEEGVPLYDDNAGSSLLEFYVISAAEKSQAALPEISEKLVSAQNQIKAVSDLGKLSAGLDKDILKVIDEFYGNTKNKIGITDLVVSDLFDASFVRDKARLEQLKEGQKARFMIKPSFTKNDFFVILHNTEGTNWEVVDEVEWTAEGNLIITVDKLSVFAIALEKQADLPVDPKGPDSPQTENQNSMKYLYAGVAVLCVGTAIFFFVKAKKKRTAK